MNFSLNEVEATAKRAARGAGYSWGHAEEAAKATRWLCAQGLDGTGALERLLNQNLTASPESHAPNTNECIWAGQKALCPLMAGAALSDCALQLNEAAISLKDVAVPTLLLPFAANAARLLKACATIEYDGTVAITDGYSLTLATAVPDHAQLVSIGLGGTLAETTSPRSRAIPDPLVWAALNQFAHRTYAPATEESRLRGAGSGLSDND
ncbi:DUF3726 domain-containing protein [Ruegeria lacuscaerulensis]|uniref:DUF3726 domain-containing protein n=1 Tax=Ruegeria lacuscaerulensis TaxID=55218 RepID=UPI00147E8BE6|nr:DUF3726 domain-containing protein [Ruegeria lacuscaerulensis]